jgi:hypothetical protein
MNATQHSWKAALAVGFDLSFNNASPAIEQRRDELEHFEFMMGPERGRLAVTLDMLTDALILIGQHGVYCASTRNPAKPALDLEVVLGEISGAKELIQSVIEQLRLKSEQAAKP